VDHRLHVRHEWLATDGHDELLSLVSSGLVDLLSVNDHSPGGADAVHMARIAEGFRGRAGLTLDDAVALLDSLEVRRGVGDEQIAELVHVAHLAGVPLASHDDADDDALARSLGWEVAVVEFPGSLPLAAAARAGGAAVLMGAPNVVRGRSHVGFPTVAEAAAAGMVDIVCSDYHLPSLFHAPFRLAADGVLPLAEAWAMVSERPAASVGLDDRGRIAEGACADLLLVDPDREGLEALRWVWRGGRVVAVFS
jgi:alpha-D-ribose 1-methylphosphonate 5-triphosphate diphosphatase